MRKNQRGFASIIFILIIVGLVGVVGFFVYQNSQLKQEATQTQPASGLSSSPIPETGTTTQPITDVAQLPKATIISTSGWKSSNINSLALKLPPGSTIKKGSCVDEPYTTYDECYLISNHDKSLLSPPSITIKIKAYLGGSRRQEAGLTQNPGSYTYTEKAFGNNNGLEAIFNCETSECTALRHILLVIDDKLIFVTDGVYKQGDGSTTLESPVTNTIISTIN